MFEIFWKGSHSIAFPNDPTETGTYCVTVKSIEIPWLAVPVGPFLPCVDLFDWWTLRCGVWVVFLLAMLGNGSVVFVLIFSRSKIDVPRFLVCNLAAADFFMGVYLGTNTQTFSTQPVCRQLIGFDTQDTSFQTKTLMLIEHTSNTNKS